MELVSSPDSFSVVDKSISPVSSEGGRDVRYDFKSLSRVCSILMAFVRAVSDETTAFN